MPRLIYDVWFTVAEYLPKKDLRSLALASSFVLEPARASLFRDCRVKLPTNSDSYKKALFAVSYVGHHVRRLLILPGDGEIDISCTISDVLRLVHHTPGLCDLGLMSLRWYSIPTTLHYGIIHKLDRTPFLHLQNLYLSHIDIHSSSPLEILNYVKSCQIFHCNGSQLDLLQQFWPQTVSRARCSHLVIQNNPTRPRTIVPINCPLPLVDIRAITVFDVDVSTLNTLFRVLAGNNLVSLVSLRMYFRRITAAYFLETAVMLPPLLTTCHNLRFVSVTLPISPGLSREPFGPGWTKPKDALFCELFLVSLPRSLQYLTLTLQMKYPTGFPKDLALRALDWTRIANHWRQIGSPRLDTVVIALLSGAGTQEIITDSLFATMVQGFPHMAGFMADNHITVMFRTVERMG